VVFALTPLKRGRWPTAAGIVVLSLGIGLVSALWALASRVVESEIRTANNATLLFVSPRNTAGTSRGVTLEEFERVRDEVSPVVDLVAVARDSGSIGLDVLVRRLVGEAVSPNYFTLFVRSLQFGRFPDDKSASDVVISDRVWRREFGGRTDVLGQPFPLSTRARFIGFYRREHADLKIVGVLNPEFTGLGTPWEPTDYLLGIETLRQRAHNQGASPPRVLMIGSIRRAVSAATATSAIRGVVLNDEPRSEKGGPAKLSVTTRRGGRLPFDLAGSATAENIGWTLKLLGIAVYFVALLNATAVYFAQELTREREAGVRLAIGASLSRLVVATWLRLAGHAALAGIGGIVLGYVARDVFLSIVSAEALGLSSAQLPLKWQDISLGLSAAILASVVVAGAVGIRLSRLDAARLLLGSGVLQVTRFDRHLYALLCIPQLLLSTVFVILTTGFVHSQWTVVRGNLGYSVDALAAVSFELPEPATTEVSIEDEAITRRVMTHLQNEPGVSAAFAEFLPWRTAHGRLVGESWPGSVESVSRQSFRGDYLRVMGLRLIKGSPLREGDDPTLVLISETLSRRFPEDPIGQRVAFRTTDEGRPPWMTIAGVVSDVSSPVEPERQEPVVYSRAEAQRPTRHLLLTGSSGAVSAASLGTRALAKADSSIRVTSQQPARAFIDRLRMQRRATTTLLLVASVCSLVFTAAALFAVTSYITDRRRQEFGLRLALGSTRSGVATLVVRTTSRVALAAAVAAIPVAYAFHAWVSSYLPNTPPIDRQFLWTAPVVLSTVVIVASWIPARRASLADPNTLLRES
jgi:predicted permease